MRRLVRPVLLLLAAACSSTPPTGVEPPPPPPAGTPASVTVQAGDGQQAAAGSLVPVNPSVLIKSASGAAVAGVTVTFSVDSGGGTIIGGTAVTNASGVATLGSWSLGPAAGRNVLRVTVTGLAPMFFTATATIPLVVLASNVTIGVGGGTVAYAKSGDPLDGLTVTVPAAAYHTATQWTVTAKQGVSVPLPAGVVMFGPVIGVTNGQAYADSILTLRIPMRVGFDTALAAFLYDSTTTTLEMVPIINRDAASITVATRHFSADRLVRPATSFPSVSRLPFGRRRGGMLAVSHAAPQPVARSSFLIRPFAAAMRSPNPPPFGTVDIVTVGLKQSTLGSLALTTSFQPGVDDWEFPDYPTAVSAHGSSAGMVLSALYYNYRFAGIAGPLNNLFNLLQGYWQADPQGIRLSAEILVADLNWSDAGAYFNALHAEASASKVSYDLMMYQSLLLAMEVTGRAQFFIAYQPGGVVHSMIAFASQNGRINVADPNTPGTFATVTFNGQTFDPHLFADNALATPQSMSSYVVYGPDLLYNTSELDTFFEHAVAGVAGDGYYPDTWLEYYNYATQNWDIIPETPQTVDGNDTLTISSDTFLVRTNCSDCGHPRPASALATRQYTEVVQELNNAPFSLANDRPDFVRGALVRMNPRTLVLGITSYANIDIGPAGAPDIEYEYADFRRLTVISTGYSISPRGATGPVDSTYTFVADGPPTFPTGTTFKWTYTFGGMSQSYTQVDVDPNSAVLSDVGVWKVKVDIHDPSGKQIGLDSTTVTVAALDVSIDPPAFIINQTPFEANPGDPVTFVANIHNTTFRPAGLVYVWNFGDPSSPVTTAASTVIHTYTTTSSAIGSFPVTVDLYVGSAPIGSVPVGHASAAAQIKVWPPVWRFTSFVRTGFDTLSTSYRLQPPSQAVLDSIDLYMGKIISNPSDGLVLISDDSTYPEHSVVLTVSRIAGAGTLSNNWVFGNYFTLVARTCCAAGVVTDVGTSTNGTLDGWSSTTAFQGGQYNEIHAIKSSTTTGGITTGTLTGTITIWSPGALTFQPFGRRVYTFTAVKISP
jgi:hypothetical protein